VRAGEPAPAAPRAPKIKLSCNLYSFNGPLRSGEMTLEQAIDFCAELGFEAVRTAAGRNKIDAEWPVCHLARCPDPQSYIGGAAAYASQVAQAPGAADGGRQIGTCNAAEACLIDRDFDRAKRKCARHLFVHGDNLCR